MGALDDLAKGLFCLAAKELLGTDDTESVEDYSANGTADDYTLPVYQSLNYDEFKK